MSEQSRNAGPGGSNNSNNNGGSGSASAKKRQRQTALTPAGLLRQRKRRGGSTSSRTPSGSRSGTPTPTKLRMSMSQGSLALPDAGSVADRRGGGGRRGSMLGLSPSAADYVSTHVSADKGTSLPNSGANEGARHGNSQRRGSKQRAASISGGGGGGGGGQLAASSGEVADHEYDDDDDDMHGAGDSNIDDSELTLIRQSQEEVKELWDQMSDEQSQRYGVYRRTALNKGSMKKLVSSILNQQVSSTLTFVVAGFSKVFVGEIVERAIQIQHEKGEDDGSPLTPEHLREAYRLYKKESQIPLSSGSGFAKRLF
ncbi:transcription initiation factor TFIID subunit 11 [Coemansia sp. RSA 1813]|nr:transcription initiation factor TFIID subunit 11 [Coemansia sp. RSA 1646]KAJ1773517.1 transcription initiation factor TFIID subunit 11 [Coemansia sp. RSA 1843]KAJ2090524.1 transcription initiation factor TFIID subunit 11 [Coemansia sp. RSA 986]KAJ2216388.1 transcription initiation factor TFIID subunit 11 [Coemansia sp. RSA 487]KAJ2570826.1 transcription initiation factor TFIID subunit 11 [Coemansia sp. RSA 1813]